MLDIFGFLPNETILIILWVAVIFALVYPSGIALADKVSAWQEKRRLASRPEEIVGDVPFVPRRHQDPTGYE